MHSSDGPVAAGVCNPGVASSNPDPAVGGDSTAAATAAVSAGRRDPTQAAEAGRAVGDSATAAVTTVSTSRETTPPPVGVGRAVGDSATAVPAGSTPAAAGSPFAGFSQTSSPKRQGKTMSWTDILAAGVLKVTIRPYGPLTQIATGTKQYISAAIIFTVDGKVVDTVLAEDLVKDSVVQQCEDQFHQNIEFNGTFAEDRAAFLEAIMPLIQQAVFFTNAEKFFAKTLATKLKNRAAFGSYPESDDASPASFKFNISSSQFSVRVREAKYGNPISWTTLAKPAVVDVRFAVSAVVRQDSLKIVTTAKEVLFKKKLVEGQYTQLNPLPHEPEGDFDDFLESGDESGEPPRQRQRTD